MAGSSHFFYIQPVNIIAMRSEDAISVASSRIGNCPVCRPWNPGPDAQVQIRLRNLQLLEKYSGHIPVVMLACTDEKFLVARPADGPAHRGRLDKLGPRPDDSGDFYSVFPKAPATRR